MANYNRKLSDEQEKQIAILNRCGVKYPTLVKEFDIATATIRNAKKRADAEGTYKTGYASQDDRFNFALKIYNSSNDTFVKAKLEEHVFAPIVKHLVENYSNYGFIPRYEKISSYIKLWHNVCSESVLEKFVMKIPANEANSLVYGAIIESSSKEELFAKVKDKIEDKYYKPLPESLKVRLDSILGTLHSREKKVLTYRYGLEGEKPKTLEDTGKIFGVTRERIRGIEANALKRLRNPERRDNLLKVIDSYKSYLESKPSDYDGKEDLQGVLDNLGKSLEEKEGGLERGVKDILSRHKSNLENFQPTKKVEKALYCDLTSFFVNYTGDYLVNLDRKINSLIILASKNHNPEEINRLLEDQDVFILDREKLREKFKIPTRDLELSVRSACCFHEAGIKYVGDIVSCSEKQLLSLRNFGKKSLGEIKQLLDGMGLQLNMKNLPKYK